MQWMLTGRGRLGRLGFRPAPQFLRQIISQEDAMNEIFTEDVLHELFPAQRTAAFFEALFGDADEGAYDIVLSFKGYNQKSSTLDFNLELRERPGRCLACNLTSGLPEVFARHKVINIEGLAADIEKKLGGKVKCGGWKLGRTQQVKKSLHCIPLQIKLADAQPY